MNATGRDTEVMSAYNTINRITSQMIEHARRNPDEIPPDIDWDGDENL